MVGTVFYWSCKCHVCKSKGKSYKRYHDSQATMHEGHIMEGIENRKCGTLILTMQILSTYYCGRFDHLEGNLACLIT